MDTIEFHDKQLQILTGDYLFPCLKSLPDIQILNFKGCKLTQIDCKAIGKALSEFKNIRELDLSDGDLQTANGKDIADGLMRAKQLEIIRLGNNLMLDCTQIVYNLAFSPKIKLIDISNNRMCNSAAVVEAFFKLLKISGSI